MFMACLGKTVWEGYKAKKFLKFYVSDNPEKFQTIGSQFFLKKISGVKKINMIS